LTDNKNKVLTEQKIEKNKFKIDLIDLTRRILIEIETNLNIKRYHTALKKYNEDWNDIFIIDAIKIPQELFDQIKQLYKKVGL